MSKQKHDGKTTKITTPTRYGSHRSMVVTQKMDEIQEKIRGERANNIIYDDRSDYVLCADEFGYYLTLESRLDNGLADPNRWSR